MAGTKDIRTPPNGAWNIAAAAGFAMYRRNAGLSGEEFDLHRAECPTSAGKSCQDGSDIYIASSGYNDDDEKFVIAHELGHAVAEAANGWDDEAAPVALGGDGNCDEADGGTVAKRFASRTAIEGIANYYSAIAFNSSGESDCMMANSVAADFDQSGLIDPDEETPSCEGEAAEDWAEEDYLINHCYGTLFEDRGTIWDWTRAFWDADSDEGITTTEIFDMWLVASPDDWDVDGLDTLTASDDVQERMSSAAAYLGFGTEWNSAASTNGIR